MKSRLIQGNEYYPFGMQTANSWTRESAARGEFNSAFGWRQDTMLGWFAGGGSGLVNFGSTGVGRFLSMALNSSYGGNWSNGHAHLFESDDEAFEAGYIYNERNESWGSGGGTGFSNGAAAFERYIEASLDKQLLTASKDAQGGWVPIKLKDASLFDIARAFRYAWSLQSSATEERPFNLNIYDLFDEEGAQISNDDHRNFNKVFSGGIRVHIVLPTNAAVGRIDAVYPYYPSVRGRQNSFSQDYRTVPEYARPYGLAIYGANDRGGGERLASIIFPKNQTDQYLGIRAYIFYNVPRMQLPIRIENR